RRHFVERHARVEADSALRGPAREIVLNAVAGEHFELARIAHKRNRENDLTRRMRQDRTNPGLKVEQLGGFVEIGDRVAKNGNFADGSGHKERWPPTCRLVPLGQTAK